MQNGRWTSQHVISVVTFLVFLAGCFAIIYSTQASANAEAQKLKNTSFEVNSDDANEESTPGKISGKVASDERSPDGKLSNVPKDFGKPHSLPLPSSMSVPKFEERLFEFLNNRVYVDELKWLKDKSVRDTGPYIQGKYYGTHPAVRVFYSPGIIRWLTNGRVGTIPDGEMIIKEQYKYPAVRHHGKTEADLRDSLESWTIMIKDSAGSHDGWFWSNPADGQCVVDNHKFPFDHPISGFGHYCVRCHAATESPNIESPRVGNEFTFSALRNIEGFPGEPLVFRVDDSWRPDPTELAETAPPSEENEAKLADAAKLVAAEYAEKEHDAHPRCTQTSPPERRELVRNQEFIRFYSNVNEQSKPDVKHFPPVTHDWVVKESDAEQSLITSNQCMSCHAGMVEPFGPSMFIAFEEGKNGYGDAGWHVSPYGEWRWSPMGLSGRDPVFFAQLENEMAILKKEFDPETAEEISSHLADTCLRCHGAMGRHQFHQDKENPHHQINADDKFTIDHVYHTAGEDEHIGKGNSKYGALARDGISCVICHRSQPRPQPEDDSRPYLQHFLDNSITGHLYYGPADEIYGPFKDEEISSYVMEHAMAMKPKHNEYISSSRMCGSCHTVNLPAVDRPLADLPPEERELDLVAGEKIEPFKKFRHHVEQATYLEWLNSEFENEFNKDNPKAKSCQDCHMSNGLKVDEHGIDIAQISTRIAAIQDSTYPDAENLTSHENLNIRIRDEGFRRHNFVGLNAFLIEIVNQFDDVLGVRKHDFMTGSRIDVDNAIKNIQHMAQRETAEMKIDVQLEGNTLAATVDIQNLAGHRFPSGVGFRRAFLELLVLENTDTDDEKIVWSSGRTNELGVLLGPDNQPLPTELFDRDENGIEQYQPHHELITSQDQVQIYETLLWNVKGEFTTSFIHGCDVMKDNRFLPKGWTHEGPAPDALTGNFLHATHPGERAARDPLYQDGSGRDSIQYQIKLDPAVDTANLTVRATLYYQAMPPYFLHTLFKNAPNGEATKRLHFILSNLDLKGTAIEDWKLYVASAQQPINN
jgi:hypothetical protein